MSDKSETAASDSSTVPAAEQPSLLTDTAPPVGLLRQLVVIPLVIVSVIVSVWLLITWLATTHSQPERLVRDLQLGNKASWQKALTLASLLGDPENESLRCDPQLAVAVADALRAQMADPEQDANRIKLQIFLCRALGEFHVDDVLPALLSAASGDNAAEQWAVRCTAIEALAVWAGHAGPRAAREHGQLLDVVAAAAIQQATGTDAAKNNQLRAAAAYTLGVIGGERAESQLQAMLDDASANTRFNAATGLARHGHANAIPVLVTMLDPQDAAIVKGEAELEAQRWKRALVLNNALAAIQQLIRHHPSADFDPLREALQRLERDAVDPRIQTEAQAALQALQSLPAPAVRL